MTASGPSVCGDGGVGVIETLESIDQTSSHGNGNGMVAEFDGVSAYLYSYQL